MKIEATLPPLPAVATPAKPHRLEDLTLGLGERIREIRKRRGMSSADLAKAIGLQRTSITNIEGGRQRLSVTTLADIAEALNMQLTVQLAPRRDAA